MPNLRQNIITGDWVVIAPERAKRPEDFVQEKTLKKDVLKDCPFCVPNGSAYKTRIAEIEDVYVIPNQFPAFVPEDAVYEQGGALYPAFKSLGYHEVVILKDHKVDLENLSKNVWDELLYIYQKRLQFHYANPAVEYSLVMHNHGENAGASIEHPHSQILATSVMPSYVAKELLGSKDYFKKNQRCIFCDLVKAELGHQERLIFENDDFVAFCAYAARFPFEIWVLPKKHLSDFAQISKSERLNLGEILGRIFRALNSKINDPDYNFFIHTAPPRQGNPSDYYHWHLEIVPRLTKLGGFELGTSDFIDVVSPEKAAFFLKSKPH
ncbi:MAG: galactose-1-phosphate uridylyltransferase [Patescibacteria group bacterium]|nr:galactose-1-phosphate uridylyltransferase [Patescibacteria group bacterium]